MRISAILAVSAAVGSLSVIEVGLRQKTPPVMVIQLCAAVLFLSASILAAPVVPAGSIRAITEWVFTAAAFLFLTQATLGYWRLVRPKKQH